MKKSIPFLIVLAAIAAFFMEIVPVAGKETVSTSEAKISDYKIRWKFEEGKNITYAYTENVHVNVTGESNVPGFEGIEQEFDAVAQGTFTFVPRDDGTAKLSIAISNSQKGKEGGDDSFDDNGGSGQSANNEVKIDLDCAPDGSLTIEDEERKASLPSILLIVDKLFQIPENASPQPGYSWEKEMDYMTELDPSFNGNVNTTFVGWEDADKKTIARFEFTLSIAINKEENFGKTDVKIDGAGYWLFDVVRGRVAESNCTYDMNTFTSMEMPNKEEIDSEPLRMEITSVGEGKITFKLVGDEG